MKKKHAGKKKTLINAGNPSIWQNKMNAKVCGTILTKIKTMRLCEFRLRKLQQTDVKQVIILYNFTRLII